MTVMSLTTNSSKLFFGEEGHGIARYDVARYPILQKLDDQMNAFFWRPQEIDFSQERKEFGRLNDIEKFVFVSNIKRQILLDSVQGRAPSLVFLPHCTDPQLENCIQTWAYFETIHSRSYTHILRAIYADPSPVYESIPQIKEIADCASSISKAYDNMVASASPENLYLALTAANALEAIRFYVSFACTFSFAERGIMESSAKNVRLIARDENIHLALTQHLVKLLPKDDPIYIQITGDLRKEALEIFDEAIEQEISWIKYLFQHGSLLGLSAGMLTDYLHFLGNKRKAAYGLIPAAKKIDHPIPWVERYLTSAAVQVAPQEVELSSYMIGAIQNDLSEADFSL